jgi:hypothetical protein
VRVNSIPIAVDNAFLPPFDRAGMKRWDDEQAYRSARTVSYVVTSAVPDVVARRLSQRRYTFAPVERRSAARSN